MTGDLKPIYNPSKWRLRGCKYKIGLCLYVDTCVCVRASVHACMCAWVRACVGHIIMKIPIQIQVCGLCTFKRLVAEVT